MQFEQYTAELWYGDHFRENDLKTKSVEVIIPTYNNFNDIKMSWTAWVLLANENFRIMKSAACIFDLWISISNVSQPTELDPHLKMSSSQRHCERFLKPSLFEFPTQASMHYHVANFSENPETQFQFFSEKWTDWVCVSTGGYVELRRTRMTFIWPKKCVKIISSAEPPAYLPIKFRWKMTSYDTDAECRHIIRTYLDRYFISTSETREIDKLERSPTLNQTVNNEIRFQNGV